MANLDLAEQRMFAQYYGDEHLELNNLFWFDVLAQYKEKAIRLPLIDNHVNLRRIQEMLNCPPGDCSECCSYSRVPLNNYDLVRLSNAGLSPKLLEVDGCKYLDTKDGCQFLKKGRCSIYKHRPDVCAQFPCQNPVEAFLDGNKISQMQYRIKCLPGVMVVRELFTQACNEGMMILPDLSLVRRVAKEA